MQSNAGRRRTCVKAEVEMALFVVPVVLCVLALDMLKTSQEQIYTPNFDTDSV